MNLLVLITFLPLVGAALLLFAGRQAQTARWIGLGFSAATTVLAFMAWNQFAAGPQGHGAVFGSSPLAISVPWIEAGKFKVNFAMDVDGISVFMVLLTGILAPIAAAAGFGIERNPRGFYALYLLLLSGMYGTFVAEDLFLFYVFWEVMLLPMYFLIGIWGGPKREFAAIKFFLYTLAGSVLMLGAFLAIYFKLGTFDISEILVRQADIYKGEPATRLTLFAALFIGFAIKVPLFPFHTWLPLAHVEAPTPISVILAGVLLKMGGYGLMRMAYPWFPDAVVTAWPWLATLAVVSIIYGAFVAMAQTDWKKLVAYSSVSHMGYVILGLSALTNEGVTGAVLQMFSHGLLSGMMFLLVGVMYDQVHHREMARFGGLASKLPKYTFIAMVGFFGSLGLPGLSGFVSEMMVFFGAFGSKLPDAKLYTIIGTIGVVMGAVYILVMIQKIFLGKPKEKHEHELHEPSVREWLMLAPLGVLSLVIGVWPRVAVDIIDPSVRAFTALFASHVK
ncbi:MAG: NAD(P)H-quinone oxidoreductase chain 4 1 [Planctomycetes bacterium]|nr:NAD(P)H-quinone oxidoreductase chain 4 1 [Planctomycetota bacterium]